MDNRFLFCNIAYMDYYAGRDFEKQESHGAGKFVEENGFGMEEYNFLNYDGKCYGYVRNPGQFNLERLDATAQNKASVNDVTIIWCAPTPKGTVIVGWYEHATLLRNGEYLFNGCYGLVNQYYVCYANAEDAYLLAEDMRTFEVPRAAKAGKGKGFGQQNYWYAESDWAQDEFIPKVKEFMEVHKNDTINVLPHDFLMDFYSNEPVTQSHEEISKYNNLDFLPLAYRMFNQTKDVNIAFEIEAALRTEFQFSMAIDWLKKIISLEGDRFDSLVELSKLYLQLRKYDMAIECLEKVEKLPDFAKQEVKDEVWQVMYAIHFMQFNDQEAMKYLDLMLSNSKDKEHIKFAQECKEEIIALRNQKQ